MNSTADKPIIQCLRVCAVVLGPRTSAQPARDVWRGLAVTRKQPRASANDLTLSLHAHSPSSGVMKVIILRNYSRSFV
eukprot:scaffold779_cov165-Amphora_coffeaeformis.AAC.8